MEKQFNLLQGRDRSVCPMLVWEGGGQILSVEQHTKNSFISTLIKH